MSGNPGPAVDCVRSGGDVRLVSPGVGRGAGGRGQVVVRNGDRHRPVHSVGTHCAKHNIGIVVKTGLNTVNLPLCKT